MVLLPTITKIINLPLSTGVMPDALTVDILSPILKKCDADFEQFQNFRPISNLKVVSRLVEKAAAIQLTDHVMLHRLDEVFQSAYKNFHSSPTISVTTIQRDLREVAFPAALSAGSYRRDTRYRICCLYFFKFSS